MFGQVKHLREVRMRRIVGVAVLGSSLVVLGASPASAQTAPTFAKDVAPILFAKCATCHRPGEVAPMSLMTYEQARPWAKAIKAKVTSREMPPWGADPRFGAFANDRSLSDRELQVISAWADSGAPRGRDADMPPRPTFTDGWEHGEPDAIVEMVTHFNVPAEGELSGNANYYAPVPFKEDKFGRLVEFRPGNRSVVHHCNASVGPLPAGSKIDYTPGSGGELILADGTRENEMLQRGENRQRNTSGVGNFTQLLDCVPGRSAFPVPSPEIGFRIPAGQFIRFGVHYQASGRPETDRSKIGLWWTDRTVVQELRRQGVGHALTSAKDKSGFYTVKGASEIHDPKSGRRWEALWPPIEPFEDGYTVMGVTPVVEPITLYGFTPHMHLRGTDMTWYLTYPDGRQETLLSVPKYDFMWQLYFELKEPKNIPAGSTISNVAHYSNSEKNKFNPAPDRPVYWSEQSWDEMFLPFIAYTVDSESVRGTSKTPSGSKSERQR
jgi:hypothetical protein